MDGLQDVLRALRLDDRSFRVLLTRPYLAFNDMHEAGHQLWTLQEEVKVVEDDLWVPGNRGSRS